MKETKGTWVRSLAWDDDLEKGIATTSVFLFGASHGQRSLVGYKVHKVIIKSWNTIEMTLHAYIHYFYTHWKTKTFIRLPLLWWFGTYLHVWGMIGEYPLDSSLPSPPALLISFGWEHLKQNYIIFGVNETLFQAHHLWEGEKGAVMFLYTPSCYTFGTTTPVWSQERPSPRGPPRMRGEAHGGDGAGHRRG